MEAWQLEQGDDWPSWSYWLWRPRQRQRTGGAKFRQSLSQSISKSSSSKETRAPLLLLNLQQYSLRNWRCNQLTHLVRWFFGLGFWDNINLRLWLWLWLWFSGALDLWVWGGLRLFCLWASGGRRCAVFLLTLADVKGGTVGEEYPVHVLLKYPSRVCHMNKHAVFRHHNTQDGTFQESLHVGLVPLQEENFKGCYPSFGHFFCHSWVANKDECRI